MTAAPLKALLVSYLFPPVGGAGVARVLKFAKFLPEQGVIPTVLTARNPSVPVLDPSRLGDTAGLEIIHARTFEPAYTVKRAVWNASGSGATRRTRGLPSALLRVLRLLLVPDPQILWQPGAQWALVRALSAGRFDVAFISGPPFSQFLLAPTVRLSRRCAVVLDYRDEWSTVAESYEMGGFAGRWGGRLLEPVILRTAHAITTATPAFREQLLERFPFLNDKRVVTLPNGFDPGDFPAVRQEPPNDRFVVTYAGTVFRLTRPRGFLGALRRLHRDQPDLAATLDVRFLGRIVETEKEALADAASFGVRCLGYVGHTEALRQSAASHLNLCLLSDLPGADRIYPQKIFELLHLQRPALTLAPPGALTRLVEELHFGTVLHPDDEAGIAHFIAQQLRAFKDNRYSVSRPVSGAERFSRRSLAAELAELFRQVVSVRLLRSST